ncbi:hypothetical protein KGO04_04490 [Patescibacteria group bacterium]|nr:hypothetical protein [Patescibacteria group bacterium]MDE1943934.1 hypothetical protein [Patescibacteria group bacterium]MDE1945481.1 hypothetical protein [Patescibacteria group bacterium]
MGFNTTYIANYTIGPYGIVSIINGYVIPVLFTIALLVFLYGVAQAYILSGGEKREEGHRLILWGVIGFVAMLSVWGLVNIFQGFFGLGGASSVQPRPPCIQTQTDVPCQ